MPDSHHQHENPSHFAANIRGIAQFNPLSTGFALETTRFRPGGRDFEAIPSYFEN